MVSAIQPESVVDAASSQNGSEPSTAMRSLEKWRSLTR
jgi:hypothetical protein